MAASILTLLARGGVVVGGASAFASNCLYDVDGGQGAVLFDRFRGGVMPDVKTEGTHFLIPWVQKPYIMDVRTRPKMINSETGTKDMQQVQIVLRVLTRPDVDFLPQIYQRLGLDFDQRVIPSIGNEVLKSVVAQYNADQLLTQREKISREIRTQLQERAADFNIILDDVSMTHLTFGTDFTKAIEMKQVAQQDAERSKFVVERAQHEKTADIIRAEGEAEAAKLISESLRLNGNGMIEVKRIDAALEIAESLSRSRNITYLPSGGSGGSNVLLGIK